MRIAVDAMGGDVGPAVIVPGAIAGARAFDVGLVLVGREQEIRAELGRLDTTGLDVEVVDARDTVEMDEQPAHAVRRKPDSSIAVALRQVKQGRAGAMVSAGNTGAATAAALLELGRLPGIDRPAVAALIPSTRSATLLLDLGAVTDPKPHHLVQFALMGRVYAERVLRIQDPTIGLLSNGEEATKGNQLVQEVHPLLAATPGIRFVGNVEGKDVPLGDVDVVVTDGFTGNVALKMAEGIATMLLESLRSEVQASLPRKLAALALRPAFRAVKAKLDYSEIGGAPLLGVNGAVILAHGRSDAKAIRNAIGVARRAVADGLVDALRSAVGEAATANGSDRYEPAGSVRGAARPDAGRT